MFLDVRKHIPSQIKQFYQDFAISFYNLVDLPSAFSQHIQSYWHFQQTLRGENAHLRQIIFVQNAKLSMLAGLYSENAQLRELLQTKERVSVHYLTASIFNMHINPLVQHMMIQQGSEAGVYVGQPVIDQHGVVGQVVEVSQKFARIQLLSDRQSAIPVVIYRNGLRGIVAGNGNVYGLELIYMPENADVRVGDILLSSDLGGRYLAGYPVGIVRQVIRTGQQTFATIKVTPFSLLQNNQHVLLLRPQHTLVFTSKEAKPPLQHAARPLPPKIHVIEVKQAPDAQRSGHDTNE